MHRLLIIAYLVLLIGCKSDYTNYYYGKQNFRTFFCSWKHYIVIEDKADSLQVWNLDNECNAGYWSTENITIPRKEGKYGYLNIEKITNRKITLSYDRGHEKVNFTLTRRTKKEESIKVININQMLAIDSEFEQYIQSVAKTAEKNTRYLTENYVADKNASLLDPKEFNKYYREKKQKVAETIIKQLETK